MISEVHCKVLQKTSLHRSIVKSIPSVLLMFVKESFNLLLSFLFSFPLYMTRKQNPKTKRLLCYLSCFFSGYGAVCELQYGDNVVSHYTTWSHL